jgi:hypothetical protein
MSSPVLTSGPTQAYQKPRPDLFTALLALAVVAIIGAIVLLYLEMQRFEFELKAPPPGAAASSRSAPSTPWLCLQDGPGVRMPG